MGITRPRPDGGVTNLARRRNTNDKGKEDPQQAEILANTAKVTRVFSATAKNLVNKNRKYSKINKFRKAAER